MKVFKDLPVGFHRVNRIPLDDSLIVDGNDELFRYIDHGTAYHGQRLLVQYKNKQQKIDYETNVILKYDSNGDLTPVVIDWPFGSEPIIKTYDGEKYILVYYYNKGTTYDSPSCIKLNDPRSWSILYLSSLLHGDTINITYLLETKNESYRFIQNDICYYTQDFDEDEINGIYDISNNNYYKITSNINIGIMPKVNNTQLIRLWVEATDYCDMLKR